MDRLRALSFVAALALIAAACTGLPAADDPRVEATTTQEPGQDTERSLLLLLDQDNAIVVVDPQGAVIERHDPPPDVRYVQPIWASGNTFVSAQIAIDDNRLIARRVGGDEEWNVQFTTAPFYYLARPDAAATTVVSLRNNDEAAGLVAEIVDGSGSVDAVSDESPFYMSWEPGSDRLATHVGGDRLDILDGTAETISASAGGFQAPVWLELGLASLRTSSGETFLSIWDGSSFQDLAAVTSAARFVGEGKRIAIQTGAAPDSGGIQAFARAQAPTTIPAGILTVIDVDTRTFTSVTSQVSPFYQWDPSGTRLLFATLVSDPEPALVWHVWEDGKIQDFASFAPDPTWFQSVVPFFDQYAQSISLWSPDGSAFAYPALVDGEPRILVQELEKASPRDIAGGVWVTWGEKVEGRR